MGKGFFYSCHLRAIKLTAAENKTGVNGGKRSKDQWFRDVGIVVHSRYHNFSILRVDVFLPRTINIYSALLLRRILCPYFFLRLRPLIFSSRRRLYVEEMMGSARLSPKRRAAEKWVTGQTVKRIVWHWRASPSSFSRSVNTVFRPITWRNSFAVYIGTVHAVCTCKSRSEKRRSCEATGEENMGGKKKARIGKGEINWGGGIIAKVVSKEEEEGHKRHDPEAYCVVVVEHTTIPRNKVAADLLAQSFLPSPTPPFATVLIISQFSTGKK